MTMDADGSSRHAAIVRLMIRPDRTRRRHVSIPNPDSCWEEISVQTSSNAWPPRIQIDYRIRGQRGRREEVWGDELEDGSVEPAANLMMAIIYIPLMDLTAPPREHIKAAV